MRNARQGQDEISSLLSNSLTKHSAKIIKFKITFHISITQFTNLICTSSTNHPSPSYKLFLLPQPWQNNLCPTYLLHPLPLHPQSIKTQLKIGKAFHLPQDFVRCNVEIQSQLFHLVTYILPLFFCFNARFQFYQTYNTNILYFISQIHQEKMTL